MPQPQVQSSFAPAFPPRRRREWEVIGETLAQGVRYLAFQDGPSGLVASYAPGRAKVTVAVARAARAAIGAHRTLAAAAPSLARDAALRAGQDLAAQLAELRTGAVRQPGTARRALYLEALADFMMETVRRDGAAVLQAWADAPDT